MVGNVKIYRDANDNIKIVKHKSTDKVDGVVALVMAIGEWEAAKMIPKSKYDDPNYTLISI
jgi:phage terminase large subunit-like protein